MNTVLHYIDRESIRGRDVLPHVIICEIEYERFQCLATHPVRSRRFSAYGHIFDLKLERDEDGIVLTLTNFTPEVFLVRTVAWIRSDVWQSQDNDIADLHENRHISGAPGRSTLELYKIEASELHAYESAIRINSRLVRGKVRVGVRLAPSVQHYGEQVSILGKWDSLYYDVEHFEPMLTDGRWVEGADLVELRFFDNDYNGPTVLTFGTNNVRWGSDLAWYAARAQAGAGVPPSLIIALREASRCERFFDVVDFYNCTYLDDLRVFHVTTYPINPETILSAWRRGGRLDSPALRKRCAQFAIRRPDCILDVLHGGDTSSEERDMILIDILVLLRNNVT